MKKCFFSKHVHLPEAEAQYLIDDILLFNQLKRMAVSQKKYEKSKSSTVDLRTKEGRRQRASQPVSMHVRFKKTFGTDDYFTNSAIREASASIRSYREHHILNLDVHSRKQKAIKTKLLKTKKRLNSLLKMKSSIIRATKSNDFSLIKNTYCEKYKAGRFEIVCFGKVKKVYDNCYDFEIQYLDRKIKQFKTKIRNLSNRLEHEEAVIKMLKNDKDHHICFGSKSFFKKQRTVYEDHEIWKSQWNKRRNRKMTISGRKDAKQGNFLFRYDINTHILTYRTQSGKMISFPCEFSYGQEYIDHHLNDGKAVAWSIEITGNSFIIKCIMEIENEYVNNEYSEGVIAFDMNYDNIAVVETDNSGNLLHHWIFKFDIHRKTTQQIEHILSDALEQVFTIANKANKPIVMEDISIHKRGSLYQNKTKNRKVTTFASTKMTQLAESKAYKYKINVKKVDPSYTSQIGKMKYMAQYGLSIHESAALVIGRRGMGLDEKVPCSLRKYLEGNDKNLPHLMQWKKLYSITRNLTPSMIFSMRHTEKIIAKLSYFNYRNNNESRLYCSAI